MGSKQYRLNGISTASGALELSEIALYAGATRVDVFGLMSASIPPTAGSLSDLSDGSTSTSVIWGTPSIAAPGFSLYWSFDVDFDITEIAIGSGADRLSFPGCFDLQALDSTGSWVTLRRFNFVSFPGVRVMARGSPNVWAMNFNAGLIEDSGKAFSVVTGPQVVSANPLLDGSAYLKFSGSGALVIPNHSTLDLGTDWEISFDLRLDSASSGGAVWHHGFYNTDTLSWTSPGISLRILNGALRAYFYVEELRAEQYLDVPITVGVAQHWRVIRNGKLGKVIRDGVEIASRNDLNTLPAPTRDIEIGRWTFSAAAPVLDGAIDNLLVKKAASIVGPPDAGSGPPVATILFTDKIQFGESADFTLGFDSAMTLDVEDGGAGRIYGTVARKEASENIPLRRRVRLFEQVSGRFIRETWSQLDGTYEFAQIKVGPEYFIMAFDHERQNFVAVADGQFAEVMS